LFGGGKVKQSVAWPPWVNLSPNAALVQVLKPAVDKNPAVKVVDLLSASKLQYRDVKVGFQVDALRWCGDASGGDSKLVSTSI
jgi:hypothetical protein